MLRLGRGAVDCLTCELAHTRARSRAIFSTPEGSQKRVRRLSACSSQADGRALCRARCLSLPGSAPDWKGGPHAESSETRISFGGLVTSALAEMNGVLRIGLLNDMSSVYADLGGAGSVLAAQMAVEDFAEQSKRKVQILSADHQNKPDLGAGIARRWFDVEGVDVIVDIPNSAVALAVSDIAREKNKVAIGSNVATALLTGAKCSANFVHWTYNTWSNGHALARGVLAAGGKSWFFITADYAFGYDMEKQASDEVTAGGG